MKNFRPNSEMVAPRKGLHFFNVPSVEQKITIAVVFRYKILDNGLEM